MGNGMNGGKENAAAVVRKFSSGPCLVLQRERCRFLINLEG